MIQPIYPLNAFLKARLVICRESTILHLMQYLVLIADKLMFFKRWPHLLSMVSLMDIMEQYLRMVKLVVASLFQWRVLEEMKNQRVSYRGCSIIFFPVSLNQIQILNLLSNVAIWKYIWRKLWTCQMQKKQISKLKMTKLVDYMFKMLLRFTFQARMK